MKNHIKKEVKKRKNRMQTIRLTLISVVMIGMIAGVFIQYWSAIPIGLIIIGIIWYILPVKNIHVYPHNIRHEFHKTNENSQE